LFLVLLHHHIFSTTTRERPKPTSAALAFPTTSVTVRSDASVQPRQSTLIVCGIVGRKSQQWAPDSPTMPIFLVAKGRLAPSLLYEVKCR
jgi:hypothetical protein